MLEDARDELLRSGGCLAVVEDDCEVINLFEGRVDSGLELLFLRGAINFCTNLCVYTHTCYIFNVYVYVYNHVNVSFL